MMRVELTRRLLRPSNAPPPPPPPPPSAALSSLADLLDENMPASRPVMPPPPDLPPLSLFPLPPPPTEGNIDTRRSFSPSSGPWADPPRLKDARDGIPGAAKPTPAAPDPCCERDRPSPGAGAS